MFSPSAQSAGRTLCKESRRLGFQLRQLKKARARPPAVVTASLGRAVSALQLAGRCVERLSAQPSARLAPKTSGTGKEDAPAAASRDARDLSEENLEEETFGSDTLDTPLDKAASQCPTAQEALDGEKPSLLGDLAEADLAAALKNPPEEGNARLTPPWIQAHGTPTDPHKGAPPSACGALTNEELLRHLEQLDPGSIPAATSSSSRTTLVDKHKNKTQEGHAGLSSGTPEGFTPAAPSKTTSTGDRAATSGEKKTSATTPGSSRNTLAKRQEEKAPATTSCGSKTTLAEKDKNKDEDTSFLLEELKNTTLKHYDFKRTRGPRSLRAELCPTEEANLKGPGSRRVLKLNVSDVSTAPSCSPDRRANATRLVPDRGLTPDQDCPALLQEYWDSLLGPDSRSGGFANSVREWLASEWGDTSDYKWNFLCEKLTEGAFLSLRLPGEEGTWVKTTLSSREKGPQKLASIYKNVFGELYVANKTKEAEVLLRACYLRLLPHPCSALTRGGLGLSYQHEVKLKHFVYSVDFSPLGYDSGLDSVDEILKATRYFCGLDTSDYNKFLARRDAGPEPEHPFVDLDGFRKPYDLEDFFIDLDECLDGDFSQWF
eukprot:TRINITY_DN36085_c0_g1_i1.p1 TRINITY_DN36085_c0_g1~~TRINITY_DN36085_c0_g1_i1.p1  ORF type:complete len:603 (-),score=107.35 TRINITY_DN36085_c0_g1_i1:276-2084(-)